MAITSSSGFFGGSNAYQPLYNNRSHVARKVFGWLRKQHALDERAQLVALIAATTAQTGTASRVQRQHTDAQLGVLGGAVTIETITQTSDTASATAGTLKVASAMKTRPSYVADAAGHRTTSQALT